MEVKDNRNTAVICLFIFRRNKTIILRKKCNQIYEAKDAIFVYFCYFVMESEKFDMTIVRQ